MPGTADLVIMGIKAGIRLGQQGRQAYAEATINRSLTLPLPNFNPDVSVGTAEGYFHGGGRKYTREFPRVKELYEKSMDVARDLTEEEEEEFLDFYLDFKREEDIRSGLIKGEELGLSTDALLSVVIVRQWANNRSPFPSTYQRVLGTLIDIGMDFYSANPGLISSDSATGRALKGFLSSIDDLDFAEENVDELARLLFVAAVETIGDTPELLGADDATSKLVETVAKGLVHDVKKFTGTLEGKDLAKKEKIHAWGQLVFRSVLSNAGETVLGNPGLYLDTDDPAREALITSVGTSVLDVIINEDSVDLTKLFSRKALDDLLKTALFTLSENPSLVSLDNQGLKRILSETARELSAFPQLLDLDILPEVMRLILEKTAKNADMLWSDGFRDPEKHLLIRVSKQVLEELSRSADPGDTWTPRLTRGQVLEVVETALDEVVKNPEWIKKLADDESPILGDVISSILSVLRKVPDNRISPETGKEVLKAAIKSVALRKEFLEVIPFNGENKTALAVTLSEIIDATLSDTVDPKARWTLVRKDVFELLTSTVFEKLAEMGVTGMNIEKVRKVMDEVTEDLADGKPWDLVTLIEEIKKIS